MFDSKKTSDQSTMATIKLYYLILSVLGLIVFNFFVSCHSVIVMHNPTNLLDLGCNVSHLMSLNNFSHYVKWNLDNSGAPVISVLGCRLDLINQDTAREILRKRASQGIAIIGDSLSRYQYLNLVYFIEHGSWVADRNTPNEIERNFESWHEFYRITNARLNNHELCDCHRINVKETTIENRYYLNSGVTISYAQLFGRGEPIFFHDQALLNNSNCVDSMCPQQLCLPGYCSPSVIPVIQMGSILHPDSLYRLVDRYRSYSHIIMNAGLWWIEEGKNQFAINHLDLVLHEMAKFQMSNPIAKMHWKTTTASRLQESSWGVHEIEFARQLTKSGKFVSFFDAWTLTIQVVEQYPELLWDNLHYFPLVYKGLNIVLLAYLASLHDGT